MSWKMEEDHRSSHVGDITKKEQEAGIMPSHGISLDVPGLDEPNPMRPSIVHHLSTPAYQSPLRHHRRTPSQHREVKETLNARSEYTNSEDDGKAQHHINQYIIKEEIGRGSFGAVHLAVDQYGTEYAVKEFSKSRLRKRAQSNILRRPPDARRPGHLAAGGGFNSPLHRRSASDIHKLEEQGNPLYLIKEEIAIMKKLNHPNLVSLIEVLDDPEEDSLYMVLEMCKKGVVMKVGLDDRADPYDAESCRCWFRDLILGIEYLHAQGVVHRDIKPDNLLLTEDDVLKIVDFGVSEMFEKSSEMMTAKSAGSPAFLPPELCVAKHGDISGKAADIWSMGVSLYCLRFGRIPFERTGVLELYEAIKNDKIDWQPDDEPQFVDLMNQLLEKDPNKRIKMTELRNHPWVTKNGEDPLLSAEENTANLVEPPTTKEVNHAITGNMGDLLVVMKAVGKFKSLMWKKRPELFKGILGSNMRFVRPPASINDLEDWNPLHKTRSFDLDSRRPIEAALATEGVHKDIGSPDINITVPIVDRIDTTVTVATENRHSSQEYSEPHHNGHRQYTGEEVSALPKIPTPPHQDSTGEKGHAHDPLHETPLFLGVGTGSLEIDENTEPEAIAESPTAAEFSIYDTAYQNEVERIRAAQGRSATVYLTRRVDDKKEYRADENMISAPNSNEVKGKPLEGFKGLLDSARERKTEVQATAKSKGMSLSEIVDEAKRDAHRRGKDIGDKGGEVLASLVGKVTEKASRKDVE